MGGRKKSPAGIASPPPLSPQERTSSGTGANSQLCATNRLVHAANYAWTASFKIGLVIALRDAFMGFGLDASSLGANRAELCVKALCAGISGLCATFIDTSLRHHGAATLDFKHQRATQEGADQHSSGQSPPTNAQPSFSRTQATPSGLHPNYLQPRPKAGWKSDQKAPRGPRLQSSP